LEQSKSTGHGAKTGRTIKGGAGQPATHVARATGTIGKRPAGGLAARLGKPDGPARPLSSRWREPPVEPRRPRGCRMPETQVEGILSAALHWKPERAGARRAALGSASVGRSGGRRRLVMHPDQGPQGNWDVKPRATEGGAPDDKLNRECTLAGNR